MAFILTKASDIRIATESAIWEWLLKLQRGNAQDMWHRNSITNKTKKKTNRRPLNTICHLIGGNTPSKALKLFSLPANSGPLGSLWSHKTNIQSDLFFKYIVYIH